MCQSVDHLKEIQFKYFNRANKWYHCFSFHNFKVLINLFYDEISPNYQIKNEIFEFDIFFGNFNCYKLEKRGKLPNFCI